MKLDAAGQCAHTSCPARAVMSINQLLLLAAFAFFGLAIVAWAMPG
jgi:hypothetical protein